MKNNPLIAFGITAICLFGSFPACKFDDYIVEKPFIPLSEDIKRYFTFPNEGSLYIYRDSLSGVVDSTVIVDKDEGVFSNNPYIGERYSLQHVSTQTRDFWAISATTENIETFRILFPVGTEIYLTWDKTTQAFIHPSDPYRMIDSVQLNGEVYRDVLEVEGELYINRLWFAKDVGLILKDMSDVLGPDPVFTLIDYHIK